MRVKTHHRTRIHVSLSLNTIESLFDHVKCGFWSGEEIPGVSRPLVIRVRTANTALQLRDPYYISTKEEFGLNVVSCCDSGPILPAYGTVWAERGFLL